MPPVSRTCSCGRAWRLWFSRERRWLWGRRRSFFRALPLERASRRISPALRLHICTSTQFIPFAAPADLRFFIQQEVLRVWRPIIVHISAFNSGEFAGIAFQDWFWRFALLENALSDMCGRCAESSAHRLSLWRDAWADLRRPKRVFRQMRRRFWVTAARFSCVALEKSFAEVFARVKAAYMYVNTIHTVCCSCRPAVFHPARGLARVAAHYRTYIRL